MTELWLSSKELTYAESVGDEQTASLKGSSPVYSSKGQASINRQGKRGELAVRRWVGASLELFYNKSGGSDGGVDLVHWGLNWSIKYSEHCPPGMVMYRDGSYQPGVCDVIVQTYMGKGDPRCVVLQGWMFDKTFQEVGVQNGNWRNAWYCSTEYVAVNPMAALMFYALQEK